MTSKVDVANIVISSSPVILVLIFLSPLLYDIFYLGRLNRERDEAFKRLAKIYNCRFAITEEPRFSDKPTVMRELSGNLCGQQFLIQDLLIRNRRSEWHGLGLGMAPPNEYETDDRPLYSDLMDGRFLVSTMAIFNNEQIELGPRVLKYALSPISYIERFLAAQCAGHCPQTKP